MSIPLSKSPKISDFLNVINISTCCIKIKHGKGPKWHNITSTQTYTRHLDIQDLRVELGRYFIPLSTKFPSKPIPLPTWLSYLMQQKLVSGRGICPTHDDVGVTLPQEPWVIKTSADFSWNYNLLGHYIRGKQRFESHAFSPSQASCGKYHFYSHFMMVMG